MKRRDRTPRTAEVGLALATAIAGNLGRFRRHFRRLRSAEDARLERGDPEAHRGPLYLVEGAPGSPFAVYGRAGEPCVRCGRGIESMRIAGRSSYACPRCQPLHP